MKLIENGMIKVYEVNGDRTVDARELHEFLQVGSRFNDWIRNRLSKYEFVEGVDFVTLTKNLVGGGQQTDYALTMDVAKELCMVENNEQGRKARKYFIEVEKRYKATQIAIPQTLPEALRLAADLAEQNAILLPKAESFDQFMSAENNQQMNTVAKSLGIGRNKLFAMLRQSHILMSDNTPYQEYIDRDYFVVKEKPITMGKQTINKPQTFVTPKGVEYIAKLVRKAA